MRLLKPLRVPRSLISFTRRGLNNVLIHLHMVDDIACTNEFRANISILHVNLSASGIKARGIFLFPVVAISKLPRCVYHFKVTQFTYIFTFQYLQYLGEGTYLYKSEGL